jgi:hypothetical protein
MSPIKLNQKITLWEYLGEDGTGGYSFSAPITVDAKFAEVNQRFRNSQGDDVMSKAVVYTTERITVNKTHIYFGESNALQPPIDSEIIRAVKTNPSMYGDLSKGWI